MSEHSEQSEHQQLIHENLRLRLVKRLLTIGFTVDARDQWGETPMMAHIRSASHFQKSILHRLLYAGANIDSRNKQGEAAIHVSVKLGNIDATEVLLGRGANVHARDREGRGVLAAGEIAQRRAKNDPRLYAGITACMALAIDNGAIASPNLFQEWDMAPSKRWKLL